jgi:hypothetical protein
MRACACGERSTWPPRLVCCLHIVDIPASAGKEADILLSLRTGCPTACTLIATSSALSNKTTSASGDRRPHGQRQTVTEATPETAAPAPRDETAKEALRLKLLALDRDALREAARADRVGSAWNERPMTVRDAARLMDRAYAVAADRTALLREEAAAVEKQIGHHEGMVRHYTAEGDKRWHEMGFLRQALHKAGVSKDRWMGLSEDGERRVADELGKLEPRRVAMEKRLLAVEKEEVAAFERAQPVAAAELAKRQERGNLAREIITERRQEQDQAREREQRRDRDHGMDR